MKKKDVGISRPSVQEVEDCLKEWSELENYVAQEVALDKLFKKDAVDNKDMRNILLKAATLNTFYSTNIYSIYAVALHIKENENIDQRLADGDISLVDDIKKMKINDDKERIFLSFASKYCSHHNPDAFPIYDYYVEAMLKYFRNCEDVKGASFCKFKNEDFKKANGYREFCNVVSASRSAYGLEKFSLKEIDRYLWMTGRRYFPRAYSKKKKENPTKDI